jgi:hypothetical protein
MRYDLRTLMLVGGLAPPAIAFLWLHWGLVPFVIVATAALAVWFLVSLALARLLARLLVFMMMD